jgi:hypothetical protein
MRDEGARGRRYDDEGGFEDGHYDDRDEEGINGRRRAPTLGNEEAGTVYLTHQGWMCKRSPAFHKKWQRRWFELRGNVLIYFRDVKVQQSLCVRACVRPFVHRAIVDHEAHTENLTTQDKSEACGSIMLNNQFDVINSHDNEFALKMTKRTYILQVSPFSPLLRAPFVAACSSHPPQQATTEKEKTDWMSILERVKLLPES